jgi:hypothetical protein
MNQQAKLNRLQRGLSPKQKLQGKPSRIGQIKSVGRQLSKYEQRLG